MTTFRVDELDVRIADSRGAMGQAAADVVSGAIAKVLKRKDTANIMFAAAPSQNEFLAALVQMPVDWSRVKGFHMDEYIGLDLEAPQGFGNFLREKLFGKVPMKEVFYMRDRETYTELLRKNKMDIVVLGIGENTHLAFNDPHVALFDDPELVKVVELDEACRAQQVNDGCFTAIGEVPRQAITVTIPVLMRADYIVGVVPGKNKTWAVARTLREKIVERFPSTILRIHPKAVLFLDSDSAKSVRSWLHGSGYLTSG
ncbi:MAG TPA: 6-phosphogluconolactonase [Puia sp.]|nr:6-phosphogluconolactonase [Puia sp.]